MFLSCSSSIVNKTTIVCSLVGANGHDSKSSIASIDRRHDRRSNTSFVFVFVFKSNVNAFYETRNFLRNTKWSLVVWFVKASANSIARLVKKTKQTIHHNCCRYEKQTNKHSLKYFKHHQLSSNINVFFSVAIAEQRKFWRKQNRRRARYTLSKKNKKEIFF